MNTHFEVRAWPALLTLEGACRYLSLDAAQFLALVRRWGVLPVEAEAETVLWRLSDLALLVKRLPSDQDAWERLGSQKSLRLDPETIDKIARAVAAHLEARVSVSGQITSQLLAIKETASLLGLGRTRIYQMINEGALKVRRIGRRTLVTRASIETLLASRDA